MAEEKHRAEIWITAEALRDALSLPSDSQITGVEFNPRTERFSFFVAGSAFPRCLEGEHPVVMPHKAARQSPWIHPEEQTGQTGPFTGVVTAVRYD